MAVTIESNQTASASSTTTLTITKPTGLAVDDLMVAVVYYHDDTTSDWNTPSGWTLAGARSDGLSGGDSHKFSVFYKKADSSDVAASNFTFTTTSTANFLDGVLLRVSGIRTDAAALGAYSDQTKTDVDNPSYTVSIAPDQENVLYVATFVSGDAPYTATDVTINGTNPTWTRYLNVAHTIDASGSCQVFAAVDSSPESSITTLTPTETGSDTGTDSIGSISWFMGQVDADTTPAFATSTQSGFAPVGSAGAHATVDFKSTNDHVKQDPSGYANSPTRYTNKPKPSTTFTNTPKP